MGKGARIRARHALEEQNKKSAKLNPRKRYGRRRGLAFGKPRAKMGKATPHPLAMIRPDEQTERAARFRQLKGIILDEVNNGSVSG